MSDFEGPTHQREVDAARATARLPGLDIEIVHRRSRSGDAEQISINLRAAPSFEAFGHLVERTSPFAFWAQAMQMTWLPWLAAAQAAILPSLRLPQIDSQATWHSADDGPANRSS